MPKDSTSNPRTQPQNIIFFEGTICWEKISLVAVKKLIQKKDSDSEDDIYVDYQPKKPKRKPKKIIPDLDQVKSYIYDPDEPRLK
ncbi:MAG: hypothetical protein ACTSWW_01370 [Promethearchaeota archaeon]